MPRDLQDLIDTASDEFAAFQPDWSEIEVIEAAVHTAIDRAQ